MSKFIKILILSSPIIFPQDKGQSLYNAEKYGDAKKYYEYVLENRNQDEAALFGLAATLYKTDNPDGAESIFNGISNTSNTNLKSKALYNLGTLSNERGELDKSLAFFKKAIEVDPSNHNAKINYEILKRKITEKQNNQEKNSGKDNEQAKNDNKSDKNNQSNGKDKKSKNDENSNNEHGKQNSENEKDRNDDRYDEKNKEEKKNNEDNSRTSQLNNPEIEKNKNPHAEAILNALKDSEQINQKRKIKTSRKMKMENDW
tara:strand:+ start:50694 stop:51470 length:777 start_codon:yes stop_codon:yes gene_type:complete